jgi:hypothetical protein
MNVLTPQFAPASTQALDTLTQSAELKLRSVWPGGNQLYLADIEKRLGFTLTAHDARTWAKALTEAANALQAAERKP